MRSRSWAWLRLKIVGLVTRPPIGYQRLDAEDGKTYRLRPLYANRLSELFYAEK